MGLLLINRIVRQNLWRLRISRQITGSSAPGQSGVGLGEKHEHFRQKTTCEARGLHVGKKELGE